MNSDRVFVENSLLSNFEFTNPPVKRRCFGVYISTQPVDYARGIEEWNGKAKTNFPFSQTNTRWNVTLVPKTRNNQPLLEQIPKAIISHDYYLSNPAESSLQLSIKRNSIFFHWRKLGNDQSDGEFKKLKSLISKTIEAVSTCLGISESVGVETHYHNQISFVQYPQFYRTKDSLRLGEVIKHFAQFEFEHEGFAPPNCKVKIIFDKAKDIIGELSIYDAALPNEQGLGINVDFKAKCGLGRKKAITNAVDDLESSRDYIHKMFDDMFTDSAKRAFR